LPVSPKITTRLYPVQFGEVRDRLAADLAANYDFALHLGQAPGSSLIRLEQVAINVGGDVGQTPDRYFTLCDDGPMAYRAPLPLDVWRRKLREAGLPVEVSYHAGTYLCNATLYWSCHLGQQMGLKTRSAFVHLPLELSQVLHGSLDQPSLPASVTAEALRLMLSELEQMD
ncbi:MAG: pyroglutamyl-peptidase I, partial [Pirellulales bacterium]